MKTFELNVLTNHSTLFKGSASMITLPTEKGVVGILPNHAPLVASLKAGELIIKTPQDVKIPLIGGYLTVEHNKVTVIIC